MIPYSARSKYKVTRNTQDLWQYSETLLKAQRKANLVKQNCMMVAVLSALKLNERNQQICETVLDIESKCAMHIRIEQIGSSTRKRKVSLLRSRVRERPCSS